MSDACAKFHEFLGDVLGPCSPAKVKLTLESPVYSVAAAENHTAASLLNPASCS